MARRWLTPRAIGLHLLALIVVPGCLVACWWQVTVALSGDNLGWLYSVEWPVFALFATYGWWTLIHDEPGTTGAAALKKAIEERQAAEAAGAVDAVDGVDGVDAVHALVPQPLSASERASAPAVDLAEEDPEMAAYNAYLAALSRGNGRKTWRDPTGSRAR